MSMDINISTPCNMLLGYGHFGLNVVKALSKKHNISLFPIGQINPTINDIDFIKTAIENSKKFDYEAPSLVIWHEFEAAQKHAPSRTKKAAISFFEMDRLAETTLHNLKYHDIVFPSSSWAKTVLEKYGLANLGPVVTIGVDADIFKPQKRENNTYTFFNMGKIERRKGHDILIEAFNKAFEKTDDVKLIMSWNNPFLNQEQTNWWINLYKESKLGDKIEFVDYFKTDYDLADFINSCDCGVFPTKAEGGGLPILQSLACGKAVIVTNYSAPTDYISKNNAYLINIDELEDAYDGLWFHGQGQWAVYNDEQVDQLVEHMRYCYKYRPENPAGVETSKQFSWENTANKIVEIL